MRKKTSRAVRVRLALAFALALAGLATGAAAAAPLRVMTFNVRVPVDTGPRAWEARRDLMARTIAEADPDVLGTQELVPRQAADLLARLHAWAWVGRGRDGGQGGMEEHMGLFFRRDRLQLLDSGDFWLSATPDVPGSISWGHPYPRMVTWARFRRRADGATFTLFDTHLPYREQDEDARLRGARLILQRLAQLPADEPFVLTGDFNTTPASPVHAALTAVLADAWLTAPRRQGPELTFHDFTGKPDRRLDWILFRGLRLLEARTLDTHQGDVWPSDHFPVLATFELPAPAR
ncbi:MAG: endonuclease/exonuclease/phosphatase family protein [Pseudoxanthomonas sp.]